MMNRLIDKYFEKVIDSGLYTNKHNLNFLLHQVFNGLSFHNKRFLDIGGGHGLFSLYAASAGAKEVVLLEPECEGNSGSSYQKFARVYNQFPELNNINFVSETFQEFDREDKFDIILLYNSINHLDETACIHLHQDYEAKEVYNQLFGKIGRISKKGSKLLVSDCSKHNLFSLVGVKNPISPNIEWEKHQAPDLWIRMLTNHSFGNSRLSWTTPNTFGKLGQYLMSNKVVSYLTFSHFNIALEKLGD